MAIVALAAVLRLATLDAQSFSSDELFSAWLMEMSFGDMLDTVPESEATPPLFYVVEWVAVQAFGTGEVGMRLVPALCGVLTVPAVYAAGALAASRRVGLAAATVVAVNPFLVWYSQEARAYAPMVLLVAISLAFLAASLRDDRDRWRWGWAIASAAALATHYFAAFVVMVAAAWLLWTGRHALVRRAMVVALPAAVGLALVPLALHQSEAVGDEGGIADRTLAARLVTIPKTFLVGYTLPAEAAAVLVTAALALVALVLAARSTGDERRTAWLALVLATAGVLLPLIVAPAGLDYVSTKNVIASLVPAALVLGCGFAASRAGWVALGVLAAISVAAVVAIAVQTQHQRPEWRAAAEALGPPRTERLLIFNPAFSNTGPFGVYFGESRLLGRVPAVGEVAIVALNQEGGFGPTSPEPPDDPAPPPPPGFRAVEDRRTDGYRLIRFRAPRPVALSHEELGMLVFDGIPQVAVVQGAR